MIFFIKLARVLKKIIIDIYTTVKRILLALGPVYDSVKGQINERELYRVISTASAVSGGTWQFFQYLYDNVDALITDPVKASMVKAFVNTANHNKLIASVFIIVFAVDFYRRKYIHGTVEVT